MPFSSLKRLGRCLLAIAIGLCSAGAAAQAFPNRPIRFVIPFAPGGGVDIYARLIANDLGALLGQSVVVENKPGGTGVIAADFVAKSPPDGHVFMMTTNAFSINAATNPKLPYDPVVDFTPIAITGSVPLMITVNAAVPAATVDELVALAKARGGKLSYSSCGNGSAHHLAGELFKSMTRIEMIHVPYKGCAPAMADVVGGSVDVSFNTVQVALPHVATGKVRAIAVTTRDRAPQAAEVRTLQEAGLAGYDVDQWFGVMGPARIPRPIVDRLNNVFGQVLARPEVKAKLNVQGTTVVHSTPEALGELVRSDLDRWGKLARAINLKLD